MTVHVKYPKTFHLPFSPGITSEDKMLKSTQDWHGQEVVITAKLDGENTSLYRDGLHARSLDFEPRPDRNLIKAFHAKIAHEIPDDFRICGENMTAIHSIRYKDLPSIFLVFSIWEQSTCLSWAETVEWCKLLHLAPVPVLYCGEYSDSLCQNLCERLDTEKDEGLVVRPLGGFQLDEFYSRVGKWVRAGHVKSDEHWVRHIEYNEIKY